MTNIFTIRSVISSQLEMKGYSLNSFSYRSGMSRLTEDLSYLPIKSFPLIRIYITGPVTTMFQ